MHETFTRYLAEVRSSLWTADNERWNIPSEKLNALIAMHIQQGTGALVFPMLLDRAELPAVIRMQMKGVCMHTMQQHVALQHTLDKAWAALTKAGIQPVLLKGAGLAALYASPEQRPWGDIDLFVGKKQYHPACAAMRDTFPTALKFDEELDHYKHYNLIADGISIEVHRVSMGLQHPIDERRYARFEAYAMSHPLPVSLSSLTVMVPEPTFNALFVMMHSWEHMLTKGSNVRQLCDLALLLHHYADKIDRLRLRHYLRALHMMDVWRLFMYVLVRDLGLPEQEAPFFAVEDGLKKRAELLMSDLLSGRLVPPEERPITSGNRFARKIKTMQGRMRNAQRIQAYSPSYARHMKIETILHGALRLFAKDRHWE